MRRKQQRATRISSWFRGVTTHAALQLSGANVISKNELVDTISSVTRLKKSSHRSIGNVITSMAREGLLDVTARGNFKINPTIYNRKFTTDILLSL